MRGCCGLQTLQNFISYEGYLKKAYVHGLHLHLLVNLNGNPMSDKVTPPIMNVSYELFTIELCIATTLRLQQRN